VKRVAAFVGSPRKGHTYDAAAQLLGNLQSLGQVETEIVRLSDFRLESCRGCKLCTDRGEERCPLKDDRDALIGRMLASDGVVFATPNYSFQVSAAMKSFLERLAFIFHRPRFFSKAFTGIVTQGFYGGDKILSYLDFVGGGLGFNVVKGNVLGTLDPMTEKQQRKIDTALAAQAQRYHARLEKADYPTPAWLKLMIFRMSRTAARLELDESFRDYTYYRDQGWFTSDYFYPVRLGPLKKGAGKVLDAFAARSSKGR
jgi:multimeric flavodoxin WrbA